MWDTPNLAPNLKNNLKDKSPYWEKGLSNWTRVRSLMHPPNACHSLSGDKMNTERREREREREHVLPFPTIVNHLNISQADPSGTDGYWKRYMYEPTIESINRYMYIYIRPTVHRRGWYLMRRRTTCDVLAAMVTSSRVLRTGGQQIDSVLSPWQC